MGLLAERAATRMQARQRYRTSARMQRRRSWLESKLGMRQDFEHKEEEPAETPAREEGPAKAETAAATPASEPEYIAELERLAQLRDQGILSKEEFEAKKKQILGI